MLGIIDTARKGLDDLLKSGVDIDRTLIDSISKLASAHANLSRESLRWEEKLKKHAQGASLEDRKHGVVAFLTSLPIGERNQVYQALVDHEAKATPGLQLKLT